MAVERDNHKLRLWFPMFRSGYSHLYVKTTQNARQYCVSSYIFCSTHLTPPAARYWA